MNYKKIRLNKNILHKLIFLKTSFIDKLRCPFLILFLIVVNNLNAQQEKINVLPPSIDNYNFTKYGGLEISGNSGGFSYAVPLYSINHGGINMPISLSYYTDGVKVNDVAGLVGINWNLSSGGMITRVVKDEPDEYNSTIKYRPTAQELRDIIEGDYDDAYYLANVKSKAIDLWNTTYNSAGANYYNKLDTEQDVFSFNFNGYSGSFYIDNGQIYLDTDDNGIKATFKKNVNGTESFVEFRFVTPDGIIYIFGGEFEFEESSEITGDCAKNYHKPIPCTWYLKSVENNKNFINFHYQNTFKYYPFDYSQSVTYKIDDYNYGCPNPLIISDCQTNFKSLNAKILKQIDFGSSNLKFNYLNQRDDYYAGNLLQSITVNNGITDIDVFNFEYIYSISNSFNVPNPNTVVNSTRAFLKRLVFNNGSFQDFEYNNINQLSPRLSYSQDVYGYNNENNVSSLLNVDYDGQEDNIYKTIMKQKFPNTINQANRAVNPVKSLYGVLNKIIYPTKGYTIVNYENNIDLEQKRVKKWITKNIDLSLTKCEPLGTDLESSETLTFISNGSPINLYASTSVELCPGVTVNDFHDRHAIVIKNITTGEILYSLKIDFNENFKSDDAELLFENKPHFAPTRTISGNEYSVTYSVDTKLNNIRGSIDIKYNSSDVLEPTLVNYGGARISSIVDYDYNNEKYNEKKYTYNGILQLNTEETSLHHNFYFSPWYFDCAKPSCFDTGNSQSTNVDCNNIITFGSTNYSTAYAARGKRVNYDVISTILLDRSGIENKYIVNDGIEGQPVLIHRKYLTNTTRSNPNEWNDGKVKETTIFKFENSKYTPLKKYTYQYAILSSQKFKNYNTKLGIDNGTEFILMDLEHVYNSVEEFSGLCNTLICNIQGKLSVEQYFNHCIIRARTEVTEIDYFAGKQFTSITKNNFTASNHNFMTSQSKISSAEDNIETKFYYALDSAMFNQPLRDDLINQNKIKTPLKTTLYKGGVKLSEKLITYDISSSPNNLLLPKYIYEAKFPNELINLPNVGNLEKKITYDMYDNQGNLLQYTTEAGIPVAIIWGYFKTQPIAKLENVTYSSIPQQSITNLQSLSNADHDNCTFDNCDEQLLRNGLSELRNSFQDAFISTYTYNPLVGVTSISDTKGLTSFYEYDASSRLKFIRDKDLNILQRYCYNYKGQTIDCSDNSSTIGKVYKSIPYSGSFTKNNCDEGGTTLTIIFTQVVGAVTSSISQEEADSEGLTKFNTDGQSNANVNGTCTFSSIARSGSFTRNNCAAGGVGSLVIYSQALGAVTSSISQADVDSNGLTKFNTDGQTNANANGTCTFSSVARSGSFTNYNCAAGGVGSSVSYSQTAGVATSLISQEDADSLGLTKFNTDGQSNASSSGNCTFYSIARAGSFTNYNCAAGGVGSSVSYTQIAGVAASLISQEDADSLGLTKFNIDGQSNANSSGNCTFYSIA
ncbi:DUF5977 domain-containing protein, partial [Flavobacterium sp. TAB 87]|uniref:DUF5977 domain-containing protein n=1 Tax=Flavobacterium sp. TAB 87 TaxID=1729581 RepID=UPI00082E03F1